MAQVHYETTTIANGATDSATIDLQNKTLCGVYMPSAITGTALGFKASPNDSTGFLRVADGAGADISKTVAASKFIPLNPADFAGVRFLRLVMDSQDAERSIGVATRPFV